MRIKEVEELVGISKKNIRFYEKEELLTPGRESENSYRDYTDEDVERLKQIKLLRKLDMPISQIKQILDCDISLATAAKHHCTTIAERRENLLKAQEVCEEIYSAGAQIYHLDVDEYLNSLENMEREGVVFADIHKNDVVKKYIGPVAVCAVIVLGVIIALLAVVALNKAEPGPAALVWGVYIVLAGIAVGAVMALEKRIQEIRRGEEDDLGKY